MLACVLPLCLDVCCKTLWLPWCAYAVADEASAALRIQLLLMLVHTRCGSGTHDMSAITSKQGV